MKKRKKKNVKKRKEDLWICSSCGVVIGKVVNRCPVCRTSSSAFVRISK